MILSQEQSDAVEAAVSRMFPFILVNGFAGSGKSVIGRAVRDRIANCLVACYSGIGSNNVGGQTTYSLFGIPTMFVPNPEDFNAIEVRHQDKYAKHFNRRAKGSTRSNPHPIKYTPLRAANFLLLDEIYALRCDHFDFIDKTLRQARGKPTIPFGGLHTLMVGDEGQGEPVVNDEDRVVLDSYGYKAPYDFRSAKVLEGVEYV